MPVSAQATVTLSVNELNQLSRGVLEKHIGQVKVSGEISNLTQASSGHWYFTLKDDLAQIRCAMFRQHNRLIKTPIKHGMQVVVHGKVSLYEGRGDYQLIASFIEPEGAGALQQRFEQLKQKLLKEGLFDADKKRAIPKPPQHLAIITSSTGAAVHDILQVLNKRYPMLKTTLIAASVQGDLAVPQLCQALALAKQWNQQQPQQAFDAIIIGRGGGSLEDLWAFNEEKLARAIADCPIPVISAVGHEVDFTISDFVADLRAPTPSAAAEMISPDMSHLHQRVDWLEVQLKRRIQQKISQRQQKTAALQLALKQPKQIVAFWQSQFKQQQQALWQSLHQQLASKRQRLLLAQQSLKPHSPAKRVLQKKQALAVLNQKLIDLSQIQIKQKQQLLTQQMQLLDAVSPLATLKRGYSISHKDDGQIVRQIGQVKAGDLLYTKLHRGIITSQVIASEEKS